MDSFGLPIHGNEISIEDFCKSQAKNIVGKRSEYTIFSNILQQKDLIEQKTLIKKHKIKVINIYRNGVDVLESFDNDWGYWNPLIWCESIRQMHAYPDLIVHNVSYEHLVRYPNLVQIALKRKLGLKPLYPFTEYTRKTNTALFPTDQERYKIRDISRDSIGKRFNVRKDGIDIDYFNRQMKSLGYDPV
jgi:hypothetical protein